MLSVRANPACPDQATAERAVNEVWESCFNDTRPFDEVIEHRSSAEAHSRTDDGRPVTDLLRLDVEMTWLMEAVRGGAIWVFRHVGGAICSQDPMRRASPTARSYTCGGPVGRQAPCERLPYRRCMPRWLGRGVWGVGRPR